jgi:hypothetical protein
VLDTLVGTRHFCLLYIIPGRNAACPRTKCVCFVATFLLAAPAFSQWNTANVDGIIESGEYGNTANGTNQIGAYEAILVAVTFNTSPGSLSYTVDGTTNRKIGNNFRTRRNTNLSCRRLPEHFHLFLN